MRKGFSCSPSLKECMFVGEKGRGLLLPCGQRRESKGDFFVLIQTIKEVVGVQTDQFRDELKCLCDFPEEWASVPDRLLFLHPLFLTPQQKVLLIYRLDWLMKFCEGFGPKMWKILEYDVPPWKDQVDAKPVFRDVWNHSDGTENGNNGENYKKYEIIRFLRNFLMHYNHYVTWSQVMCDDKLIKMITSMFPWLFSVLFRALCKLYMGRKVNDESDAMWKKIFCELDKLYVFLDA